MEALRIAPRTRSARRKRGEIDPTGSRHGSRLAGRRAHRLRSRSGALEAGASDERITPRRRGVRGQPRRGVAAATEVSRTRMRSSRARAACAASRQSDRVARVACSREGAAALADDRCGRPRRSRRVPRCSRARRRVPTQPAVLTARAAGRATSRRASRMQHAQATSHAVRLGYLASTSRRRAEPSTGTAQPHLVP